MVWFSRSLGFRSCCCCRFGFWFLSPSPPSSWISLGFGFLDSAAVDSAAVVTTVYPASGIVVYFRRGYFSHCVRTEPFGFAVLVSLFLDIGFMESKFLLEFFFLHN